MPMPWTYRNASKEWRAILDDLKDRVSLVSDNSAYTAMGGVLRVFRRRLTAQHSKDWISHPFCLQSHGPSSCQAGTSVSDRRLLCRARH